MKNQVMSKTFIWMFVGLLVTFITGYAVSLNETMILNIFKGSTYIILCVVELILVIFLSAKAKTMHKTTAKISFILYSFVTGLTLSSIFIAYELTSIMYVFLIAAVIFITFGFVGYYTNLDLTKISTFLLMALFAVIACVIVNLFINNNTFDLIITIISILIFIGFTAYDVQKIKLLANDSTIPEDNLSIIGALNLYLDFINIFLDLIRLFGNSKD